MMPENAEDIPTVGSTVPEATIKSCHSDFRVEELPLYEPSGIGGHVFIKVRKRGWSTLACIQRIARHIGVDTGVFGYAGMKDRHAITVQTISFAWSESLSLPSFDELVADGIEVVSAVRHPQKLRIGHLAGNRFAIVLRDVVGDRAELASKLESLPVTGVPNAFGPQRFGRDGSNPERTLAWFRGEIRGPRDRRIQRLLASSVQSWLFDRLLALRVANGTWHTVVAGDLVKKLDTGGMFLSENPLEDAARALARELTATGPIYGSRMRWPESEPLRWEKEVLDESIGVTRSECFERFGVGSRRALRVLPTGLGFQFRDEADGRLSLDIEMTLPKGAYATTVLRSLFVLRDASQRVNDSVDFD